MRLLLASRIALAAVVSCAPAAPADPSSHREPPPVATAAMEIPSPTASSSAAPPAVAPAAAPFVVTGHLVQRAEAVVATGYRDASANALAVAPDGRVVVTGHYRGENASGAKALPGPDGFDAFLAELGPDATLRWERANGAAIGADVAFDAGGDLRFTAEFMGKVTFGNALASRWLGVLVARLDPRGEPRWAAQPETKDVEHARRLAVLPGGDTVITGQFFGFGRPGTDQLTTHGGADVFVMRVSPDGKLVYRTALGEGGDDDVGGVAALPDGGVLVTGFLDAFAGNHPPRETSKGFVARLDPLGKLVWMKRFGSQGRTGGTAIVATPEGGAWVAGVFRGATRLDDLTLTSRGRQDVFLARLGADGRFERAHAFEGPSEDRAFRPLDNNIAPVLRGGGGELQMFEPPAGPFAASALARRADGALAMSGWFAEKARFGATALAADRAERSPKTHGFVALLDGDGNALAATRLDAGRYFSLAHDVAFDARGRLVVAAETYATKAWVGWFEMDGAP
jgi:hypothetical protein